MNESDGDEDFVAKGTPLYDYLVQIGVIDPKTEDSKSKVNKTEDSPLERFLDCLLEKFQIWLKSNDGSTRSTYDNIRAETGRQLPPLFSRLLLPDDFSLLQDLQEDYPPLPKDKAATNWLLVSAGILVGLVSLAVTSIWTAVAVVVIVALCGGVAWMPRLYLQAFLQPSLLHSCSQLTPRLHSLLTLLHRCLAYLREAEVLEFGYTLHSLCIQSWKSSNPALQKSSDYSELKKRLALILREIFFTFQKATQELRSSVPLAEFDLESFYLRHVPLEEFNLHLELDLGDPHQEKLFCDFFAGGFASNLKTLFDLTLAQVSEFLRRLCLCFLATPTNHNNTSVLAIFSCCRHQTQLLLSVMTSHLVQTEDFHQVHCARRTTRPSVPPQPLPVLDSPLSGALYHLQLNLHCLLSKVNQLAASEEKPEELLQSEMSEICDIFSHTPGLVTQAAKLIPRKIKEEGAATELGNCPEPPLPPPPSPSLFNADPVIHDQVFIGRADPASDTADFSTADCKFFKPVSQKVIFKDVFKELKMAIAIKAEEHKQREAKALAGTEDLEEDDDEVPTSRKEDKIEEDIPRFQRPTLPSSFSSMIASMAQQHSERLGLVEETFSDSDDSNEPC